MSTILGLDIGTEFVKAVLAKPEKKGNIEILGVAKVRQNIFFKRITINPFREKVRNYFIIKLFNGSNSVNTFHNFISSSSSSKPSS